MHRLLRVSVHWLPGRLLSPMGASPFATTAQRRDWSSERERVGIVIQEEDLEEKFVRGSGPGGQKVNKTSSCVDLLHRPSGIRIKCQATRSREQNRQKARRLLRDRLDELENGPLSKLGIKEAKLQKKRARQRKRAARKYGHDRSADQQGAGEEVEVESSDAPDETPSVPTVLP